MKLKVSPAPPLTGQITVPGDKSISHRTVMFASLAEGDSQISNWLPAADCWATVRAMQALGVPIDIIAQSETAVTLKIQGVGLQGLRPSPRPIDCYGSGTTMRLLSGIVAGQNFETVLDGHEGLRHRPMERIAKPLRQMGADIRTREGHPPLEIQGGSLTAIDYALPVASAQVKSAVLLAGLFAQGETIVREPGPARDHTERLLKAQGVDLQIDEAVIRLTPPNQPLAPLTVRVPADFSSAAFLMVAGLLVPHSNLTIAEVNTNPTRTGLLDALQAMGANLSLHNHTEQGGEAQADIQVQHSQLQATEIAGPLVVRMIDEFPILAVAATQADGLTLVRDAAELRVKETDRIAAVVDELSKMGAKLDAHQEGFVVSGPTPLKGAPVNSHADHRLAMALTVAGLIAEGETTIHGTDVIGDSYPGFVTALTALGVQVESL